MRTKLAISDLTRMSGNHVCIAGYTPDLRCIRPVFSTGLTEEWLYLDGHLAIQPFAILSFDLIPIAIHAPHVEDHNVALSYQFHEILSQPRRQAMLNTILDHSVTAIYGAPIFEDHGHFLLAGTGQRSLGTIRPASIEAVMYEERKHGWDYRLRFIDGDGNGYALPINDLAWRCYCDFQRDHTPHAPADIANQLLSTLQSAETYLRIGTSRGWELHPDRCYLQITGIYSFPDYLAGRCFADFIS